MKDYRRSEARTGEPNTEAIAGEQAERYAGHLVIERGPAAFRVTFPRLSDPDAVIRKAAFSTCRPILADVKSIMGRRYDAVQAAWIVPLDQSASVEALSLDYHGTITEAVVADDVAQLRHALDVMTRERDAAVALATEYAALLDGGGAPCIVCGAPIDHDAGCMAAAVPA